VAFVFGMMLARCVVQTLLVEVLVLTQKVMLIFHACHFLAKKPQVLIGRYRSDAND
jgi:hypothetical protein